MYNFTYSITTIIHFGKGQISHLRDLRESGTRVLVVYGGGSIKRSGLYDEAMGILREGGLTTFDLPGVEPNPRIETVRKGVELCRSEQIDMVLAIGGGSSIDCAKVIAAGARYDGDAWDLVLSPDKIKTALPIYSVLTLSATGSEMDHFAVISDLAKNEKRGIGSEAIRPTMSILDPTYTYTVPRKQTAAGTADMMSHTLENYFTFTEGADIQLRLSEALLKTIVKYGPVALQKPDDYDARANLMWAGSYAINGIAGLGSQPAWCVHPMEHELSAFYDITHGEGLAILTPAWMEHVLDERTAPVFAAYGRNVWGVARDDDMEAAKEAIRLTADFLFVKMGMPRTLRDVGITEKTNFRKMAEKAAAGSVGSFVPLTAEDIVEIFEAAF